MLSAAAAPVLLIGGWSVAAARQPHGFDPTTQTISALAAHGAADRWLMTSALVAVGVCHMVTALGLRCASPAGRCVLATGGAAVVAVAAIPQPVNGTSTAHALAAGVSFVALAVWPALASRGGHSAPWTLHPVTGRLAAAVLLGLVSWFAVTLLLDAQVGLAERVAAGAEAIWPFVVAGAARFRQAPEVHAG